ncbi:MAG: putative NAD-dependent epimerase/dehydratase family protein [Cyclobacteriaceae bacterium]|jgi:uncharacterized NAD-dependent epimerase/dehydratase family protein
MKKVIDGNAIVYCEGAFNTPVGKTAHGLIRFTERYHVLALIDSTYAGQDAGEVLDGKKNGIPIFSNLNEALKKIHGLQYFVIGLAPDGGRLPDSARRVIHEAVENKLNVDSGLHDFLYKDQKLVSLAKSNGCKLRDIRRTPEREELHFFTGNIEEVDCLKLAVLGTDSAVGKRTTAWIIVHGLRKAGKKAQMIGTGQTGWMQGAKYSLVMDSLINDFVSGEIEYAVYEAWKNESPDAIVIEGQGSLMNPAYPGGFEILAAGRPDFVILQHAPRRKEYDGFPGYPIQPIKEQIAAIEMISGKKVLAITLNHEDMEKEEIDGECIKLAKETGLLCTDVLQDGPDKLVELILRQLQKED